MTNYIICTPARTGSNLLCDVLRNTGQLGTPIEAFNPDLIRASAFHRQEPDPAAVDLRGFIAWTTATHRSANGIFGTKILFEDFEKLRGFPAFRDFFLTARLIHLRRRSKLRQAISYFLAQETGQWVTTDIPRKPPDSIAYDFAAIRRHLDRLVRQDAAWTAMIDALGLTCREVIFEHFIADMPGTVGALAESLGVPPGSLPVRATLAEQRNALTADFVARFRADLHAAEFAPTARVTYKGIDLT